MSNGKGSTPRPLSVDAGTFAANWDRVFGSAGDTRLSPTALPEGSTPADSRRPGTRPATIDDKAAHLASCFQPNCDTCWAIYEGKPLVVVHR
jgi:hypothetical protein